MSRPYRTLRFSLAASAFFWSYELGAQNSFYLLECSLILLGGSLLVCMAGRCRHAPLTLPGDLLLWDSPSSLPLKALLCYVAADLAGAVYAPQPSLVYDKYRVVLVLALLAAALLFVRRDARAVDGFVLGVALSSPALCAAALAGRFGWSPYPLYYTLRLSLRADYNMFATAVFTGMAAGAFWCLQSGRRRVAAFGPLFFILPAVPVIIASASRRIYIVLPPTLLLLLASWIVAGVRARERLVGRGALAVCAALVLLTSSRGLQAALSNEAPPPSAAGRTGQAVTPSETTAAERYDSIGGGLLTKRRVIWAVAFDALSRYDTPQLLLGKGSGESILLYDRVGEPLDAVYPDRAARRGALSAHNMLLADLLDGGLLKLLTGVGLLAAAALWTLRLLRTSPLWGLHVGAVLALSAAGCMVSNRFGLLYDRYFVLYVALLAILLERGRGDEGRDGDNGAPA